MVRNANLSNVTLFIIFAFPLILLSSFNSNSISLQKIGALSILLILIISLFFTIRYLFTQDFFNIHIFKLLIVISVLTMFMIMSFFVDPNPKGLANIGKFIGAMSILIFFSLIEWTPFRIKITFIFSLIMLIALPFISILEFSGPHYAFILFFVIFSNTNKLFKYALSVVCIYLIYLSDARAVLLLTAVFFLTHLIWKFITKNRIIYNFYLFSIISLLLGFIFVYPNLINYQWFQTLNNWFIENTGARLNSGRDIIWAKLTEAIFDSPFFGYGPGVDTFIFINKTYSTHNLFIQIAIQSGLITLSVFLILLLVIWNIYYVSKTDIKTRLSASFFVGIVVYSSFEVILIQNKMDTATMLWLIISIGISSTIYRFKKTSI